MPSATPVPIRRAVYSRRARGQAAPRIAAELGPPARTVRALARRFRERGGAGIEPDYARPAAGGAADDPAGRAALHLRREHPGWGAGLIRVAMVRDGLGEAAPSERTILPCAGPAPRA